MLLDPKVEPATVRLPGGRAIDRATGPGDTDLENEQGIMLFVLSINDPRVFTTVLLIC